MEASCDVAVDEKERSYVFKKLLLKKAFEKEMELFIEDASARNDPERCPSLLRAYQRVLASPLFPPDQLGVLHAVVDDLPELQLPL